jgi:isopentenyl-diphosphate Delta-isomerase
VASGGLRTGLELAKVLALGASLGGMALPFFRAQQTGGLQGAEQALSVVISGLRQALVLTGSRNCGELRQKPRIILGELKDWLAAL